MTNVYYFKLWISGTHAGNYAAFDESETAAKIRIEEFFKKLNPAYHVEAELDAVAIAEKGCDPILFGTPTFCRRKAKRSE